MSQIPIYYSCFLNATGYSQAAQNYLMALNNSNNYDIKVKIFGGKPTRPAVSDEAYELFMKMKKAKDDSERIQIYHCIPTIQRRVKKLRRNIGFATYETFSPPDKWIEILNQNDGIIVPSQFNYNVFAHMKIKKPLFYIPHCLDMDRYNKDVNLLVKMDRFTFLFMGTWKVRKGYEALIEAWLTEFKEKDDVQLLIKTDKIDKAKKYVEKIKRQLRINKGFAPILFELQVFSEKTLPRFIKSVDCLISPSLGEGFSYVGLQCMALGIPVIITNFSGCKDYATKDTATLMDPDGFVLHHNMDGIPQFKNKKWAFISVKKIKDKMRYVLNNKEEINKKSKVAYKYVREHFNYSKIENMFKEMIEHLYGS